MNSLREDEDEAIELHNRLVAIVPPVLSNSGAQSSKVAQEFKDFGEQLWSCCREAILFWTPTRLETEALRRASDGVESSIARVTASIVERYLPWVHGQHLLEASYLDPGGPRAMGAARIVLAGSFVRARLQESIEMLERRAVSVEARALDLRLRFDHQKLAAELFGKQLQSTLRDAIQLAASESSTDPELERIAKRLDQISTMAPLVQNIEKEVQFIADQSMSTLVERRMQPPALVRLKKVGTIVTSSVGKTVMTYVLKMFTGGS